MRWVAIFDDDPGMLAVRQRLAQAHLDYLAANAGEILIGGGLRAGPEESFCGGLWVMDVPSRERAVELIEKDPYYTPALRRFRLFTWGRARQDRMVQL